LLTSQQTTLITWHRPYLAFFEQILARHVRKAAKQYPVETIDAYTAAAQSFRIPYWDWAQDASLPPAVVEPTVNFDGPAGPAATMRNPLYSFQFPNFPFRGGGFGGSLAQFSETKRCTTVSGAVAGVSDEGRANSVMIGDGGQLQDKVVS
jgi:tyrosinase